MIRRKYRLWKLNRKTLKLVRDNMRSLDLAISYGWSACDNVTPLWGIYVSEDKYKGMEELHSHFLYRLREGEV